ncbi:zinc-dependent metalloprotease [Streptomyces sp. NPDC101062]|uniref:zinc-dependent metalloprotease n=1 Tax=unclassified Streptomyces TaxID=2593676 RepID=UPI0037F19EFD
MLKHARWADQLVTHQLLGAPVNYDLTPRSDLYQQRAEHDVIKKTRSGPSPYVVGAQFVTAAIAEFGLDTFNRIWPNPELIPLASELADPGIWHKRVASA